MSNKPSLYVLTGSDYYVLSDAVKKIKSTLNASTEHDYLTLNLNQSQDWQQLVETANNYSLFFDRVILEAHLEKRVSMQQPKLF